MYSMSRFLILVLLYALKDTLKNFSLKNIEGRQSLDYTSL